ncbi:hypothetical protein EMCRGX_G013850 [Ephydatia muelleri]
MLELIVLCLEAQSGIVHTAGYVFGPLLQQDLKEFKDMWNCHRIRRNSFMGEEYRQSIDPGLLAHCMVHCAHNALAPFYPPDCR